MSAAWVAFARTGNPNHDGIPQWPPYNARRRPTMVIDTVWNVVDDLNREERLAMASLATNHPPPTATPHPEC